MSDPIRFALTLFFLATIALGLVGINFQLGKRMKKARIVERTKQDGTKKYLMQTRFLFWWLDGDWEYDSLAEVKKKICFHDGTKPVDRVVDEDPQHEPDPAVSKLVLKLKSLFEKRLKEENDPEDFLRSMRPQVVHELKQLIPHLVNEAEGKLYVLDSPVHGGKAIVVEGDFAQKMLTLGDLPC